MDPHCEQNRLAQGPVAGLLRITIGRVYESQFECTEPARGLPRIQEKPEQFPGPEVCLSTRKRREKARASTSSAFSEERNGQCQFPIAVRTGIRAHFLQN